MAVTLDPQLLDILACPAPDHAPLTPGTPEDPEADALTCTSCGRVYEVRDGIPVLLLDEAVTADESASSDVPPDSEKSTSDGA
ncbi:Trm112 family protein [Saccharomonospora piscinae]|uniref:Trm112 family protein n=1 Tax=Saccharomonospora piscinae TaxID=687388 RepID=UPI0004679F23|nr:Trm112 family protein [Saccharomonospora piscinae]